ncbi:hypothetical protein [Ramlibacter sp. AN1133]|uniref:hypothetical protein n=1 Tax=Ramlibacter sp. AN1133 TaxID=3133429 RepID=UPI0030BC0424
MPASAAQFLLEQALRRYAADCRDAMTRLRGSRTIEEVKRAADVHAQPIARAVHRTVPEHRALAAAAQQRAEEICRGHLQHLEQLAKQDEAEAFSLALERYRRRDWQLLRGDFPRVAGLVDRESRSIEHAFGEERPRVARPRP